MNRAEKDYKSNLLIIRKFCCNQPESSKTPWNKALIVRCIFIFLIFLICCFGVNQLNVVNAFQKSESIGIWSEPAGLWKGSAILNQARKGFKTSPVASNYRAGGKLETPPPDTLDIIHFDSDVGPLAAYLSPDPGDGKKHPAVLWAHPAWGRIGRSIKEVLMPSKPFIENGIVVMWPAWRGEADNPGEYEMFYGEVDDAIAALKYLRLLPYVDPDRVYMAGNSTGGTLALLTAESSDLARAYFSLGGSPDLLWYARKYGNRPLPVPFDIRNTIEGQLRSPIHFIEGIKQPTFCFMSGEGEDRHLVKQAFWMDEKAQEKAIPFKAFEIKGANHFQTVFPMSVLIMKKIFKDRDLAENISITDQEVQREFDTYMAYVEKMKNTSYTSLLLSTLSSKGQVIHAKIAEKKDLIGKWECVSGSNLKNKKGAVPGYGRGRIFREDNTTMEWGKVKGDTDTVANPSFGIEKAKARYEVNDGDILIKEAGKSYIFGSMIFFETVKSPRELEIMKPLGKPQKGDLWLVSRGTNDVYLMRKVESDSKLSGLVNEQ